MGIKPLVAIEKYKCDMVVATESSTQKNKCVVYHANHEPETIDLVQSKYAD